MKKLLFSVTMFCLVLLSVSCDKDEKMLFGAKETRGILTVHSTSYEGHEPIENVSVEVIGVSDVQGTNKEGVTKFELKVGDYEVKVSKDGYLAYKKKVSIGVNNGESDLPVVGNVFEDFDMYPLTAALKGNVIVKNQDEYSYVANAVIIAKAKDIEFISPITTTTATNGTYNFTLLPEGLALDLEASINEDGVVYEGTGSVSPLKAKQEAIAHTIELNIKENNFGEDIVKEPKTKTDKLIFIFNIPVSVDEKATTITSENRIIAVNKTLSNENRQLTIIPEVGYWETGKSYSYNIKVKNSSGQELVITKTFIPKQYGQIFPISAKLEYGGSRISWEKQENASYYEIFRSEKRDGTYEFFKRVYTNSYLLDNDWWSDWVENQVYYNYVKIIGVNDEMRGDLDSTTAISFEDEI